MKVLPINFNYNKNTSFCGNKFYSIDNWITLRDVLNRPNKYWLNEDITLKSINMPAFNKAHFEYSDYKLLSPKEKLIISILSKKGNNINNEWDGRQDTSVKKDAERIYKYASKIKEYFDGKYKNGYKLVGIGNSPTAVIESLQLLGADAVTLPFSKVQIDPFCEEFPYKYWSPQLEHWEKCDIKDWEEYFKFYGIDKDLSQRTGKTLIFTDYICEGETKKYIESILEGIGFKKNYEFIGIENLLPPGIKFESDCNLGRCFDNSAFKDYAKMESAKRCFKKVDIIKHPEYIPSLPETLKSKLFRCALYDLLAKK